MHRAQPRANDSVGCGIARRHGTLRTHLRPCNTLSTVNAPERPQRSSVNCTRGTVPELREFDHMPYAILDLSNKRREAWRIAGCVALAIAFCYLVPEYGYIPVLFLSPF